ncbi:MAG: fructose-bisphosphatase class II [Phycisphaera sp.]|nr:MAG: fructose-bisphosphatase class II [Phycisphaera sp.]
MDNTTTPSPSNKDTHRGLRFGALELIRCTEQTAVLMSDAEGRGVHRDEIGKYATMSMAGYLRQSTYRARFGLFDEIYDREDEAKGSTPSVQILRALERVGDGYREASGPDRDGDLDLDFCCAPIDGRHALSMGHTGGTVSAIGFAAHRADNPIFAPPRQRLNIKRGRGQPAHADRSPPWLILAGSAESALHLGGVEAIQDFLRKLAGRQQGDLVEDFVSNVFDTPGSRGPSDARLPIRIERSLAVLDQPRFLLTWDRRSTPSCKKRVFTGSSLAINLAAMFDTRGFDCALSITRHLHAVQASIAARALGGFVVAVPLCRAEEPSGPAGNVPLCIESDDIWTHTKFVRSTDAALVVSGISENVVLSPVRIRGDQARVNTLSLSARTKSMRKLDHRITLSGPSATRFACFDEGVFDSLKRGDPLPEAEWDSADEWRKRFDKMLNRHHLR